MAKHLGSQFVAVAGSRGSITLPADVRRRYHLDEPGAQVEVIGRDDGVIELHPVLPLSADQAWFWTERWQAMQREAEAVIVDGRTETFATPEELIADLDREAGERGRR
jgi:bifunctional DNA-binding transcriptional regulator/antitoxin component of YhaV-PrlF toxin-antitoxin module